MRLSRVRLLGTDPRFKMRNMGQPLGPLAAGNWGYGGYLDSGGLDYAVVCGHLHLGGGHGSGHCYGLFREFGDALLGIQDINLFVGRGEEGPAAGVASWRGCSCG